MTPHALDALDALRDIHLPVAHAWWAIQEVWVAAACIALAASWIVWRKLRHPLLRRSLRALSSLEAAHGRDGNAVLLARGLSQLLRGHAAACFPQAGVEGLTGGDWLAFLDTHGGGTDFSQGAGAVLESLPYRAAGAADTAALVGVVRKWLRENPR